MSKQRNKEYEKGRRDEAEVALSNLYSLKAELEGVGYDPDRSFLNTLIKDLEKYLSEEAQAENERLKAVQYKLVETLDDIQSQNWRENKGLNES